jgi:hypothetical protein
MRVLLVIFGVFAAVACIETPAAARSSGWCANYNGRRCHQLWVCDISAMYGRRERSWRVVVTQPVLVAYFFNRQLTMVWL